MELPAEPANVIEQYLAGLPDTEVGRTLVALIGAYSNPEVQAHFARIGAPAR